MRSLVFWLFSLIVIPPCGACLVYKCDVVWGKYRTRGLSPSSLLLESFPLACLVAYLVADAQTSASMAGLSLCLPSTFTFTNHSTRFISVCLSVRLSSIYLTICQSSNHLSVRLAACLSDYQSINSPSVYLSVHLSTSLCVCMQACMHVFMYVCMQAWNACFYVFMNMHEWICMDVFSICLEIWMFSMYLLCRYVSRYIFLYGIIKFIICLVNSSFSGFFLDFVQHSGEMGAFETKGFMLKNCVSHLAINTK